MPRRPPSRAALLAGLSVGGVLLVVAVVAVVVVVGRRGGPNSPAAGAELVVAPDPKPVGKKWDGEKDVEDPTLVDRAWPKLTGRWEAVGGAEVPAHEFRPGYRYRMGFTAKGERSDVDYQVAWIRDDSAAQGVKDAEVYTVYAREAAEPGFEMTVVVPISVHPDGTLTINHRRYRRAG